MAHGPGHWLCFSCFEKVSDHPDWKPKMRLIDTGPPDFGMEYRAKLNQPCARCKKMIWKGDKTQKVDINTPGVDDQRVS